MAKRFCLPKAAARWMRAGAIIVGSVVLTAFPHVRVLSHALSAANAQTDTGTVAVGEEPVALELPPEMPDALDVATQVRFVIAGTAARWGVDGALLLRIAECESRLNPSAIGSNGAAGLFQIVPVTWKHAVSVLNLGEVSPLDPVANTEVAAWLLASAGPKQWGCP